MRKEIWLKERWSRSMKVSCMKESGSKMSQVSAWAVVYSYGQMALDMRASGAKVRHVVQVGSYMPMVIAMRASGGKGRHADKAFMSMQMAASTSANSTLTTKTVLVGKSGQMAPLFKDSS